MTFEDFKALRPAVLTECEECGAFILAGDSFELTAEDEIICGNCSSNCQQDLSDELVLA